jgi:hydrogenase/urease accessory protein HupE
MQGELRLGLDPVFSGAGKDLTPHVTRTPPGAAITEWTLAAPALRGQSVSIPALSSTMTDALVRVEFLDGTQWTQRLTPARTSAEIPRRQSALAVAAVYLELGVQHILTGFDHLLFVLALLIVTRGGWPLIKTVTAFTVAHSLTLALATLGVVHVPPPPVEAMIALSIAFVAAEILRGESRRGLTARAPWIVAFAFGLLHGLGFAGALSEVGLPQGRIPLALLCFNLGVEAGQLLFIAAVLATLALARRIAIHLPRWADRAVPYAIGSIAMFWVIQRVAAF